MVKYRSLMAIQWQKRSSKAMRRSRGRRKNRRQRRDDYGVPFDLIVEILTRLPATSLMRFMCVSKLWCCLIRSRYFCNRHLTVASSSSRPPLRLYMSMVEHYMCDSMELHNPGKSELRSLRLLSSNRTELCLETDLTFPGMGGRNMVVLRGLILYAVCRKVCIYNPATRQRLTLPLVKSNIFTQQELNKKVNYFFGYDPVHDQYKVVCNVVVYSEVRKKITFEYWVFVLEPGGFWRKIEYDDQPPHLPTRQGICINGVIYYLAFNHTCRDNVYCFDVRSEEFRVIQGPHEVSEYAEFLGFIEHGGKPAIFDFTHIRETGASELWVLEVDGGTWSRKSLVLKPCQKHLMDDIINIRDLRVHGTGQDNEVILALHSACYLLYYDLKENDLRKVNIIDMPPYHRLYVYVKVLDMCENIMHLEL